MFSFHEILCGSETPAVGALILINFELESCLERNMEKFILKKPRFN